MNFGKYVTTLKHLTYLLNKSKRKLDRNEMGEPKGDHYK